MQPPEGSTPQPPEAPNLPATPDQGWMSTLADLPSKISQPFALSAVALVASVFLGIFGPLPASLSCIGIAVVLLIVGLWRQPTAVDREIVNSPYQAVTSLSPATPIEGSGAAGVRDSLSQLETLCFLHLYELEGGSVGRTKHFPLRYFVDLMTASLVPEHRAVMVTLMQQHIKSAGDVEKTGALVGPKRGNCLLVTEVAQRLGLRPLLIKERPLFGRDAEGIAAQPKRAVIVDDISSDGDLLVDCVHRVRRMGYVVDRAYVLIDRTEGDSASVLAEVGVTLLPIVRLGDIELEDIVNRARATLSTRQEG